MQSHPDRRARASACGPRPRPKKIRCASLRAGLLTQTQCHPRLPNPQWISGRASAQRRLRQHSSGPVGESHPVPFSSGRAGHPQSPNLRFSIAHPDGKIKVQRVKALHQRIVLCIFVTNTGMKHKKKRGQETTSLVKFWAAARKHCSHTFSLPSMHAYEDGFLWPSRRSVQRFPCAHRPPGQTASSPAPLDPDRAHPAQPDTPWTPCSLRQLPLVPVCHGSDVHRIHAQNRSARRPFRHALPQDLVEDLPCNVVVPEAPPVPADRRRGQRPARRFQSTEPFVRDVAAALSFRPPLRLYPLQASHKQHLKQDLSVHSGSAVIRAVQRRTQIANEAEIHGAVYLSQQAILRQHLLHDRQVCLPLPHPAASILFAIFSSLLDIFGASPFGFFTPFFIGFINRRTAVEEPSTAVLFIAVQL